MTYDIAITALSLLFMGTTVLSVMKNQRIARVMHEAIRKSDRDGNDFCRIPRNQVIETMGWQKVYDVRPSGREFTGKPDYRHPSTHSPARRRKLRV